MSRQVARVIGEFGLTLVPSNGKWVAANADRGQSVVVADPGAFFSSSGLQPILVTEQLGSNSQLDLLLRASNRLSFGLAISDAEQRSFRAFSALYKTVNVIYLLEAVQYHCTRLCLHYSSICATYSSLPFDASGKGDVAIFQGRPEPYFEFDALVTAIRRAYDALRYLVWQFFGPGRGSLPISLYKTIPLCKALPASLADLISTSWKDYGEQITAYRDCVQHYSPIDFGLSSVRMQKREPGVWTVSVLIPDNPSAKSRSGFVYSESRDALRYGWKAADEILRVSSAVLEAIPIDDAQPVVAADRHQRALPAGSCG